jgi:exodeoxyribonuclease VIII
MLNHIMLDIETLSTDSYGVITSISAVQFDLATCEIGSTFETALNIKEQLDVGCVIDNATVAWWFSQDAEAINATFRLQRLSVASALHSLNDWINLLKLKNADVKLWGNGCTFDNVMVRNLYKKTGIEFVLPFWCDNDVRTLVTLSGINVKDFKFDGTKHYGIDDCKHQIKYCNAAYKALK